MVPVLRKGDDVNAVFTIPQPKVACDVSDRNGALVAVQSPKWVGPGHARERRKHRPPGEGLLAEAQREEAGGLAADPQGGRFAWNPGCVTGHNGRCG